MPKIKNQKSNVREGFSLIELIIIIAIVGIITAVTTVSMQSSKTDKELEAAAREVAAAIREAQNNALTGKRFESDKIPCFIGITRKINGGSLENKRYQLYYNYHSDDDNSCNSWGYSDAINLPSGVKFASLTQFGFSVPFGIITADKIVELRSERDSGKVINVCVSKSGNIIETEIGEECSF